MAAEKSFFFEGGLSLHQILCGDIVRNAASLEEIFSVRLTMRDNFVVITADTPEQADTVERLLAEFVRFFHSSRNRIPARDFQFLCRLFAEHKEEELTGLWSEKIQVSPKKPEILPRSRCQFEYVRSMRTREIVFGIGPAGTGKTYLAMAMAVSEFLKGRVSRIILTRPARESGENLGFLPGSLEDKVMPYLRPLYDAMYDMMTPDEAAGLIERNIIEVAPLAFMRGRTLNDAFIILDEAQNTTEEQMLMFLTRMGFQSRCVITGDPDQSDLEKRERSGLKHALESLRSIPEIGFHFFSTADVVRHALIGKIINAYNLERRGASCGTK